MPKFIGRVIRLMSPFIFQLNPSLTSQFDTIKKNIDGYRKLVYEIPSHITTPLILIEDKRFFKHKGIDIYSIMRATYKNITSARLEGASTIVQQLVRNITNEREINITRKIKEIFFATLLDNEFTKKELLYAYLVTYRFKNCVGIFAFCQNENYNLNNLSIKQAAEIAARFKYPSLQKSNYSNYLKRVRTIEIKNLCLAKSENKVEIKISTQLMTVGSSGQFTAS